MRHSQGIRLTLVVTTVTLLACARTGGLEQAGDTSKPFSESAISIDGRIGVASLVSLSDAHFQKMADSLQVLALSGAAQSGDWAQIKRPLAEVAKRNVAALNWFALPDGSYWSVQSDKEPGNLAGRDYFPMALAGQTVIGELVVSKSTDKPVAIVAVPVHGEKGAVVGVLGASVYLDQLSARLSWEMDLDDGVIFYAFDRTGRFSLQWDPSLIFLEAGEKAEEEASRAIEEMLSKQQGVMTHRFRGNDRIVLFRRSPVTGWWLSGSFPRAEEKARHQRERIENLICTALGVSNEVY